MPEYIEPMKPIIEIVAGQMRTSLEGELYRAVQNVGINVDKDGLLQALNDARSFYAEGYRAGQKAADVVAVKHGRWEFKHPNGWACSECGEWGLMIDNRGICKSNYCPNCGAKMQEEDK